MTHKILGICEICGEVVGRGKYTHYKTKHPEIVFEICKKGKQGNKKTGYACGLCLFLKMASSYRQIVEHFQRDHGFIMPSVETLKAAQAFKARIVETPKEIVNPISIIDNFFDGMGRLQEELKELREKCQIQEGVWKENQDLKEKYQRLEGEVFDWKSKCQRLEEDKLNYLVKNEKWAKLIVNLQEQLGRRD